MCGVLVYKGATIKHKDLYRLANTQRHRGPDTFKQMYIGNTYVAFHRLAINDYTSAGNQPYTLGNLSLVCNGEIFNARSLIDTYNLDVSKETSDCFVILHLYKLFNKNINTLLSVLDGVYAFVIVDANTNDIIAGRDQFGVRPLYLGHNGNHTDVMLSSQMKPQYKMKYVSQFLPGHSLFIPGDSKDTLFTYIKGPYELHDDTRTDFHIYNKLENAVFKRLDTSKKVACLLSGGLDSSVIAHLLSRKIQNLHTFSIGQSTSSPDIIAARKVAAYIGSVHHEVLISAEDMFNAIPDVIEAIESYDTTTIRASTPMYLLCKYIRMKYPDIKVLFSGEGSDELFGGYLYMGKAPTMQDFQQETKRLLDTIHYYDGLRADRCATAFSFELYVPFLDKDFVQMVYNIPPWFKNNNIIEKWCLRNAFRGRLPDSIVWRRKEAFSDGISTITDSWHTFIKNKVDEKEYYKEIFNDLFPNRMDIIPGLWLPRWNTTDDPSARELNYENKPMIKKVFWYKINKKRRQHRNYYNL